ncbi:MAG TPA: GEVED domain-containing protein [Rhodothermales bacterium]|nr:GEVED domain-containing protein [Rhodothermales bacterium]
MRYCFALLIGILFSISATAQTSYQTTTRLYEKADTSTLGEASLGNPQLDCPATLLLGQDLAFNGSFSNSGTVPIEGAFFRMTVNTKLSLTQGSTTQGTWSGTAQQLQLNMGTVAPGQEVTFDLNIATVMSGTATIETVFGADGISGTPENCEIEILEQADLVIDKEAPATARVGGQMGYSLLAGNSGPHTAEGVVVTDDLPLVDGTLAVRVVEGGIATGKGTCENAGNQIICDLGALAPGEQVEILIQVEVLQAGALTNHASVAATQPEDPDSGNNEDEATTEVTPGLSYEDATALVIDLVPDVCPTPTNALAYLRQETLQPDDTVAPAFGETPTFTADTEQFFGWIDCEKAARFSHLGAYVFIDLEDPDDLDVYSGEVAWPEINGTAYPDNLEIDLNSPDLIFGDPVVTTTVTDINTVTDPVSTPSVSKACALLVSGQWNEKRPWEEAAFDQDIAMARGNLTLEKLGPQLDPGRVETLKNPTPVALIQKIGDLALNGDCDKVYFYYTGHGAKETGALVLNGSNLSLETLAQALSILDAELCVILDSCFSGNAVDAFRNAPGLNDNQLTLITASSSSLPAWSSYLLTQATGEDVWIGFFSYNFFLCFGDPNADFDEDGEVTLAEAYEWVQRQNPIFGNTNDRLVELTQPALYTRQSIEVAKTVEGRSIEVGDLFAYVVTVTNPDPSTTARDVKLNDLLPGSVSFRSAVPSQGTCMPPATASSSLSCDLGDIPPGGSATVTINVQALTATDATNTAQVGTLLATVELVIAESPTFSVCGQKFWDIDGDGIRDVGEPGQNGFVIELLDEAGTVIAQATTGDEDRNNDSVIDPVTERGRFCFDDLPRGTYTIREVVAGGWVQTHPAPPGTYTIQLATGTHPRILFGNQRSESSGSTICGQKFWDINGDGVRDAGEPGIDGFPIELLDENSAVIARITTASEDLNGDGIIDPETETGRFCFKGLPDGTYTIREVASSRWIQTFPATPGTYTVQLPLSAPPLYLFGNRITSTPPPETPVGVDFGDLPDPCAAFGVNGRYPTLNANNGPGHFLGGNVLLGNIIDAEMDGQPDNPATGDNLAGLNDEEGLRVITALANGALRFTIFATVAPLPEAYLDAWIDIDEDCRLNNAPFPVGERVLSRQPHTGLIARVNTPPGLVAAMGNTPKYFRLRLSSAGGLPPTGLAFDGEVEDYTILVPDDSSFVTLDFGDAPASFDPNRPDFPGGYPTTLAQNGARHATDFSFRLGAHLDPDVAVSGRFDAKEDDENRQQNDEDGFRLLDGFGSASHPDAGPHPTIEPGSTARILPLPTADGKLDAWIDWNRDGDWDDEGEQIFASLDIDVSMEEEDAPSIPIPDDAALGFTYARFRFSQRGGYGPTGVAPVGEVEDMLLEVVSDIGIAIEQAPEQPKAFTLYTAYPNPFNPSTTLRFDLPEDAEVHVEVFDLLGRQVLALTTERIGAGANQTLRLDASALASGLYLYRFTAQGARATHTATGRLVLVK